MQMKFGHIDCHFTNTIKCFIWTYFDRHLVLKCVVPFDKFMIKLAVESKKSKRLQLNPVPICQSIDNFVRKLLCRNLGRVRLGIFRNKNVFRNIFRLFFSWEQNSQNGIQVFRNENNSQTNAYFHYSNFSYSGLIPNERALKWI